MDYTFPEKYHKAAEVFDHVIGDLESTSVLDNEHKLMFYALRQQAEKGPCTGPAPSVWRFVERHKHNAWSKLSAMSSFEAMVHFVRCAETTLFPGESLVNWREKHEATFAVAPASSGAVGGPTPVTSSSSLVTVELSESVDDWDDDLRAHAEPSHENVVYLVSQVMHARRQYEALQAAIAAAGDSRVAAARPLGSRQRVSVTVPPPGVVNASTAHSPLPPGANSTQDNNNTRTPSPQPSVSSWTDWFGW